MIKIVLAALGLLAINVAILFAGFLSLSEQNDEPSVYAPLSGASPSRAQNDRSE